MGQQQDFYYNSASQLRVGTEVENCVTAPARVGHFAQTGMTSADCGMHGKRQTWEYELKGVHKHQIRSPSLNGQCLDAKLTLAPCATAGGQREDQVWFFEENQPWK